MTSFKCEEKISILIDNLKPSTCLRKLSARSINCENDNRISENTATEEVDVCDDKNI